MELLLTDTAVAAHLPTVVIPDCVEVCASPWFASTPGFDAYDAAKWTQRTVRAVHGDREALAQLDRAGFALTVF
jgi:hypothetical protein|nr:MAG TPA: hypothetical protein [Bacteriophage sp.]